MMGSYILFKDISLSSSLSYFLVHMKQEVPVLYCTDTFTNDYFFYVIPLPSQTDNVIIFNFR